MDDLACDIRAFFNDFLTNQTNQGTSATGEESTVPLRSSIVENYRITPQDIFPEVLDWTNTHLEQRKCPLALAEILAQDIASKLQNQFQSEGKESDFFLDSGLLQSTIVDEVTKSCLQYQKDPSEIIAKAGLIKSPSYLTSVSAIKNTRRKMEDRHVVIHNLNAVCHLEDLPHQSYYAIFDGHAGVEAATFTAAHLHWNIVKHPAFVNDIETAIKEGFRITDEEFLARSERENIKCGTTALCCLVRDKMVYVAWLGDSQVVLARQGNTIALVQPHKPELEKERERIQSLGGYVVHHGTWRVNGTLAVSRAIGDPEHKPYVTSEPDIQAFPLDGQEDFLVLACDGLWDALNPEEVSSFVYGHSSQSKNPETISSDLVNQAKALGSTDNITAIVVYLKDPKTIVSESPNFNSSSNWMSNPTGSLESGKSIYVYNSGLTVGDPIGSNGPEEIYRPFSGLTLERTSISELPTPPIEDFYSPNEIREELGNGEERQAQNIVSSIVNSAIEVAVASQEKLDRSDMELTTSFMDAPVFSTLETVLEAEDSVSPSKPWMLQMEHSDNLNRVDYLPPTNLVPGESAQQAALNSQLDPFAPDFVFGPAATLQVQSTNPFEATDYDEALNVPAPISEAFSSLRPLQGIQEMIGISESVPGSLAREPTPTIISDNPFHSTFEEILGPSAFPDFTHSQKLPANFEGDSETPLLQDFNVDASVIETEPLEMISTQLTEPEFLMPSVDPLLQTSEPFTQAVSQVQANKLQEIDLPKEANVSQIIVGNIFDAIIASPKEVKTSTPTDKTADVQLEGHFQNTSLVSNPVLSEQPNAQPTVEVKTEKVEEKPAEIMAESIAKSPEKESTISIKETNIVEEATVEKTTEKSFEELIEKPYLTLCDGTELFAARTGSDVLSPILNFAADNSPATEEILPAADHQLDQIPDGIPEAEGVTEDADSDSEKDGGWSYVEPSTEKTSKETKASSSKTLKKVENKSLKVAGVKNDTKTASPSSSKTLPSSKLLSKTQKDVKPISPLVTKAAPSKRPVSAPVTTTRPSGATGTTSTRTTAPSTNTGSTLTRNTTVTSKTMSKTIPERPKTISTTLTRPLLSKTATTGTLKKTEPTKTTARPVSNTLKTKTSAEVSSNLLTNGTLAKSVAAVSKSVPSKPVGVKAKANPVVPKVGASTLSRVNSGPSKTSPNPTSTLATRAKPSSSTSQAAPAPRTALQGKETKETVNKQLSKQLPITKTTKPLTTAKTTTSTLIRNTTGVKTSTGATKTGVNPPKGHPGPITKRISTLAKNKMETKSNGTQEEDGTKKSEEPKMEETKMAASEIETEKFSIEEQTKELPAVDSGLASPESPESPQNGIVGASEKAENILLD